MHGAKSRALRAWFAGAVCAAWTASALVPAQAQFDGASALAFTAKAVSFGPRPAGSENSRRLQAYIKAQLRSSGCEVIEDAFVASTPLGPKPMKNLVCRLKGTSGRAVAVTGHYDTKIMPGINFVGANDGGASTGFLLELARVLAAGPRRDDVYLVWFDGEEAVSHWTSADSLYGSRHLAGRWAGDGTLKKLKALMNIDMIGDRNLGIIQEWHSDARLRELVWRTAAELGHGDAFLSATGAIEDDHKPFLDQGVAALDLIDFEYGPENAYWHTEKDSMDKLAARSFQVVGDVVLAALKKMENWK